MSRCKCEVKLKVALVTAVPDVKLPCQDQAVKVMIWVCCVGGEGQRQDKTGVVAVHTPLSLRIDEKCIAPVLQYLSLAAPTDLL